MTNILISKSAAEPLHPAALSAYKLWVESQVAALEIRIHELRRDLHREQSLADLRI